jgi:hypothetical protein
MPKMKLTLILALFGLLGLSAHAAVLLARCNRTCPTHLNAQCTKDFPHDGTLHFCPVPVAGQPFGHQF